MLEISPKYLAYLSILMGAIVLLTTIGIIIFPKVFANRDSRCIWKGKETRWKTKISLFINDAINPVSVPLFYFIGGCVLVRFGEVTILGIGVVSMVLASVWFWTVKRITQRARPETAKIHFKDYSFPSGHTTAGFVFFLSLGLWSSRLLGPMYREFLFLLALGAGTFVARSRRYLHVHWLSDVIIGALLWCWCFLFSYLLFFYFWDALFFAIEQVFFTL